MEQPNSLPTVLPTEHRKSVWRIFCLRMKTTRIEVRKRIENEAIDALGNEMKQQTLISKNSNPFRTRSLRSEFTQSDTAGQGNYADIELAETT
ncbi:hypothetical protein KIN20_000186 [Parelaphostrongylus tenuis]|uniref:Uncharacterized protein n=1 Tax=Parelaphostrongylus tenuis TaxID=148309 RepID=A0AAD5QBN7_PARTN|nr:hypothetical protein KIN20_000186 [Parelaphostrongylus tenuis]